MTNDEIYFRLNELSNGLRRMLNTEDVPPDAEQNISDAIVYLDCAKHNLAEVHEDAKNIYRVAPTIVARAAKVK